MKRIPRKLTLANCTVRECYPGHFVVSPNFTESTWGRRDGSYYASEHYPMNRSGFQQEGYKYSRCDADTTTCRRIDAVINDYQKILEQTR